MPLFRRAKAAAALDHRESAMSFFSHLEDLRWTMIKCAIVAVIFATLIGFFLRQSNDVVLWPLHRVQHSNPHLTLDLGTTSIMEGFSVVVEICCVGGLLLAAPFCLFFIGQFIAPALTERELKLVLPACVVGFMLFLVGSAFSFFLLVPSTINVSVQLNELFGFVTRWTPDSYYSLLLWLVLGVGAAFEFPLLIVVMVFLGLLRVQTLRKFRRHAIVAILIIAAVVTPTPDPFTQLMFATPLYILFEIAIIVSSGVQKKREAARALGEIT